MSYILRLFFLSVILLASTTGACKASPEVTWQSLESGLSHAALTDDLAQATIHLFSIDLTRFSLAPIVLSKTSVKAAAEKSGSLITINANFFDESFKPLGLIIHKQRILNPFRPISWWGIFSITQDRAAISHSSEFNPNALPEMAIQAGPRLIENGKRISTLKANDSAKTALCIQDPTHLVFLVSRDPISVDHLVDVFQKTLRCTAALNLDGGSSTQLYAKVGTFALDLPSYALVPAMLGVFRK